MVFVQGLTSVSSEGCNRRKWPEVRDMLSKVYNSNVSQGPWGEGKQKASLPAITGNKGAKPS